MRRSVLAAGTVLGLLVATTVWAQLLPGQAAGQGGGGPAHSMSAQQQAPVDMTGYWVSIITQDWLYRMVVPQRGDYSNVPINLRARQFADAWDRSSDEAAGKQCEAYGAAAIMHLPEYLHISWRDPQTLQVQIDAGMQTRLLLFDPAPEQLHAQPSLQGTSVAQWMPYLDGPGFLGAAPRRGVRTQHGWLQVTTTDMLPGLLRKNGVPYSGQTHMTENWAVNADPEAEQWLTVATTLDDPTYLQVPYVLASIFQKQADGGHWDPTPCSLSR